MLGKMACFRSLESITQSAVSNLLKYSATLWLQENVQKASKNLDKMSDAFFVRLVPSEDMVIKTADLAVSLKKVSSDDLKGLSMEEGPTKFKLPGNLGDMGGDNVNAKVRNP